MNKSTKRIFRLPPIEGAQPQVTTSIRRFDSEWNKIFKPLEKLTGLKVTGFDPSIQLNEIKDGKFVNGTTVTIPVWFAHRIIS